MVEPEDVEPDDVEPEDVEPEDVEPEDVEPEDVEPDKALHLVVLKEAPELAQNVRLVVAMLQDD